MFDQNYGLWCPEANSGVTCESFNKSEKGVASSDAVLSTLRNRFELTNEQYESVSSKWRDARRAHYTGEGSERGWEFEYAIKLGYSFLSGWMGKGPDLSIFDLSDDADRGALALGTLSGAGLRKLVQKSAQHGRELMSGGYTGALELYIYENDLILEKPLEDLSLELVKIPEGTSRAFGSGTGKFFDFDSGAGRAYVPYLKPGEYELRSALLERNIQVNIRPYEVTRIKVEID